MYAYQFVVLLAFRGVFKHLIAIKTTNDTFKSIPKIIFQHETLAIISFTAAEEAAAKKREEPTEKKKIHSCYVHARVNGIKQTRKKISSITSIYHFNLNGN